MAYSYSDINNLLGQGYGQNGQGAYGGNPSVFQANSGLNSLSSPVGYGFSTPKVDISGDIASTPVSTSNSGNGQTAYSPTNTASAAIQANISPDQNGGYKANTDAGQNALSAIGSNLSTNQNALNNQEQSYLQSQAKNQTYGGYTIPNKFNTQGSALDTSLLDQAIAGDPAKIANTYSLLNQTQINPVASFNPGDLSVNNANLLTTPSGIEQLAQIGQGPGYTPGMSAFDATLLGQDTSFNNRVNALNAQNQNLQNQLAGDQNAQTGLASQIQGLGQKNLADAQTGIRNYLGQQSGNILSPLQAEADQANAAVKALSDPNSDKYKQLVQNGYLGALNTASGDLVAQYGQRVQPQIAGLNESDYNPSQYLSFASYNPMEFLSNGSANSLNAIAQMLGQPQNYQAGKIPDQYTFQADPLVEQLVGAGQTARNKQDLIDQGKISDINKVAQGQADQANQAVTSGSGYQKAINDAITNYLSQNSSNPNVRYFNTMYGNAPTVESTFLNNIAKQYVSQNPYQTPTNYTPATASNFYTGDQANQLNDLAKDLGQTGGYQAGSYTAPNMFTMNQGLTNDITNALNGVLNAGLTPQNSVGIPTTNAGGTLTYQNPNSSGPSAPINPYGSLGNNSFGKGLQGQSGSGGGISSITGVPASGVSYAQPGTGVGDLNQEVNGVIPTALGAMGGLVLGNNDLLEALGALTM